MSFLKVSKIWYNLGRVGAQDAYTSKKKQKNWKYLIVGGVESVALFRNQTILGTPGMNLNKWIIWIS